MQRTIMDLAFSRTLQCPFIVGKIAMANLHNRLHRYGNENALLSPDAQVGMRKLIAAALGERKGLMPEGETYAVYPCSVDVEHVVDRLCGPRPLPESFLVDELDWGSGTISMDSGTDDDTPSIPSELPTPLKAVGWGICKKVVGTNRADDFPGRTP